MFQQIFALLIIVFFLVKVFFQHKKKEVGQVELFLWMLFWVFVGLVVVFIKEIDLLVARLGFSASGIDALLYLSVAVLFYLIFKLRLKLEKIEREITRVVRKISLKE